VLDFEDGGEHFVELRDVTYRGGDEYRYRLRIGEFPLASVPFPLVTEGGKPGSVEVAGPRVDDIGALSVPESTVPIGESIALVVGADGKLGSDAVGVEIGDMNAVREAEPDDVANAEMSVELPAAIDGRIGRAGDRDAFVFDVGAGERWTFVARARALGSPCVVRLGLLDAGGKLLEESVGEDDDEASLDRSFDLAGKYGLVVEDLGGRGGPDYAYRIEAQRWSPTFSMSLEADRANVKSGETLELKVLCTRRDFDASVRLELVDAEANGLETLDGEIPAKKNEGVLRIRASADLEPGSLRLVRVVGRAMIGTQERVVRASTAPALRKLLPRARPLPPGLDGIVAIGIRE
jgi:hypothetical protein